MPIDPNRLNSLLDEQDAEQSRRAAVSAPAVAPDAMGRAMRYADDRGLPVGVVADNLADFDERDHLDQMQAAGAANPAFARWAQRPEHAALAKGDVPKLSALSRAVQAATRFIEAPGRDVVAAFQGDTKSHTDRLWERIKGGSGTSLGGMAQQASDAVHEFFDPLAGIAASRMQYGPAPASVVQAQANARGVSNAAEDTSAFGADYAAAGRAVAADAQQGVTRPTSPLDAIERPGNTFDYYGGMVGDSTFGILLSMLTRQPIAGAGVAGATTSGQSYSQYRSEGESVADAQTAALHQGLIEGAFSYAPLAEAFGGAPFWKRVFSTSLKEARSEGVTQALQDSAETTDLGRTMTVGERVANVIDATIVGGVMGPMEAIGGSGAQPQARREAAEKLGRLGALSDAQLGTRIVSDIVEAAQASATSKNAPVALAALVREVGPDANVYLSAEQARTLFQSERQTADAFVGELLGEPDALREAEATGGDLVIPMAAFVSRIATLPNATDVAQHVRLHADHLSRAELESDVLDERLAEWFGDTDEAAERAKPSEGRDTGEQVTQDVLGMLLATNQYRPADAELQAKVVGRVFARMAARSGQDAFDLYSAYKLRVNGNGGAQGKPNLLDPRTDALLTAARSGTIPSERAASGLSITDTIVRMGGVIDDGGELRSFDARKLRPGLMNKNGMPLDMAREALEESGFLPEGSDINDLIDAIDRDLRGDSVFSEQNRDADVSRFRDEAMDLSRAIDDLGDRDISGLSNQELHDLLFPPERSMLQRGVDAVRNLFQSGKDGDKVGADETPGPVPAAFQGLATIGGGKPAPGWVRATRIVGSNGLPAAVHRGSRTGTTRPEDFGALGAASGNPSAALGLFLTNDPRDASRYGQVGDYFLDLRNPKEYTTDDAPDLDDAEEWAALRRELQAEGHDGVVLDFSDVGGPVQFVVFKPEQVIPATRELLQPDGAGAGARGRLRIGANRTMSIDLFNGADLSTFLHESAHFFLEVMQDVATGSDAVRTDLDAIRAWVGNDGGAFTEDQHEQFARGWEAYLREGKSPAPELVSMFARFRAWLTGLYRDLAQLNVTLTDEVRSVFDRMIATDEEIEAAQAKQGAPLPLTEEARALLPAGQWDAYVAANREATEEARAEVMAKMLAAHKRAAQAWYREQLAAIRADVDAEFEATPVVRAWRVLAGRGDQPEHLQGLRLDRAALVAAYGDEWVKSKLLRLGVYRKEGGVHPDVAASALGFPSGDALVKALAEVRDLQARVEDVALARMRERHPDPLSDGSLPEAAMDAVHGNKRVAALEREMDVLAALASDPTALPADKAKTAGKPRAPLTPEHKAAMRAGAQASVAKARHIREFARRKIAALTLRAIRPNDYLVAERKAARLAAKEAGQGKFAEALAAKRAQALNAALYGEARAAQDRADAQAKALRKLASDTSRERIGKAGKAYLDALDALLEGHELRPVSGKEVRRREALRAWAESQQDEMGVTILSPALLDRIESERVVNVADLTMQELGDLYETATNIAHLARLKNKLLKGKDARDWDVAKSELLERTRAVLTEGKAPPLSSSDLTLLERMGEGYAGFMDWMLRPETVIEWLDGGQSGPWHEYFWEQMEAGEAKRAALRRKVGEPLAKILTSLPKAERKALDEIVHVRGLGRSMSRNTILSALLNMGTASSRDKLARGGVMVDGEVVPFSPDVLAEMLSHLTTAQANIAQQVWDALDVLWPEIEAQQIALSGFAPEKLDALPVAFTTSDGNKVTLRGGYYPAVYDPRAGHAGAKQDDGDKLLGGNFTSSVTSKGHTKERTSYAAPMLLDYHAVLSRHLNNVITDIAYRQPLRQMLRILSDSTVKGVIHQRLSSGAYHALLGSVRATIQGTNGISEPASAFFEKVKGGVIRNTVVAALGFKIGLVIANTVTAPVLATARVKTKFVAKGLARYYRHPKQMTAMVHGLSPFMLDRATHTDQGYAEVLADLRGRHGVRFRVAEASLAMHRWVNPLVERGIWLGRYIQATSEGEGPAEAVRLADKAIRQTQTQAAPKDLSAVERDPRYKVFNLFLGPMIIANNRLQEAGMRGKLRGAVESPSQALGTWLAMILANGFLFELLSGRGPEDDDDDGLDAGDWGVWLARKALLFPFQTMPFVRNAANMADQAIGGDTFGNARPDPITDAMSIMGRFGKVAAGAVGDLLEGEDVDEAQVAKAATRAAGVGVGLPTGQAMTTGEYLYDLSTDPDTPLDPRYLVHKRDK